MFDNNTPLKFKFWQHLHLVVKQRYQGPNQRKTKDQPSHAERIPVFGFCLNVYLIVHISFYVYNLTTIGTIISLLSISDWWLLMGGQNMMVLWVISPTVLLGNMAAFTCYGARAQECFVGSSAVPLSLNSLVAHIWHTKLSGFVVNLIRHSFIWENALCSHNKNKNENVLTGALRWNNTVGKINQWTLVLGHLGAL